MITKEQAIMLRHGDEIHVGECKREVGPRGGVKVSTRRMRVASACATWKREPHRFRVTLKYGLYYSGSLNDSNNDYFHLPEDCPIRDN